jgi:hypothetical protein
VQNTRASEDERYSGGHGTHGFHGRRLADWADVLREPSRGADSPPVRHCWYDGPNGRQAALLLGWRSVEGRYSGRVAVAALEPDGWAIVEMWVDQGMLSPA